MRAFQLKAYDGPSGLQVVEVPPPVPGPDDLLVDVRAIGINYPDLLMTRGQYQLKPELPFVPGCEVAGVVARAPKGSDWKTGDRVSAFIWQGGYAEQVLVPAATAARLPDDISDLVAAATTVNYQTVVFALERRARLESGERVLVLGAAGGIGTAAVQVARAMGAYVIGAVATQDQVRVAIDAGADEAFVAEPGFARQVKASGDVGAVVDPVGDWLFDEALRCLAPEGRLVVIGFAAGKIPSVAVNRLLLRNISVVGAAFGAFLDREPELVARQASTLYAFAQQGVVNPHIDRQVGFEDIPAALEALGRGEVRGKAVVMLGGGQ